MKRDCFAIITMVLLAATSALAQTPIGTTFTYQGRIKQSGNLVTNSCDFRFKLFGSAAGADQVGPELIFDGSGGNGAPIAVANGLFRSDLDFGGGAFTGDKRWLEIRTRVPHGTPGDPSGYVTVSPRQELTPTPYALQTRRGNALDAADGTPAQALFVDNSGNVGIGTTNPTFRLEIPSSGVGELDILAAGSFLVRDSGGGYTNTHTGYQGYVFGGGNGQNGVGYNVNWMFNGGDPFYFKPAPDLSLWFSFDAGNQLRLLADTNTTIGPMGQTELMRITNTGNVGIGTTDPTSKLHIGGTPGVDGIRFPDGTLQTTATMGGGNLDHAYDFGGRGAGRFIFADAGAVEIVGAGGLIVSGMGGANIETTGDLRLSGGNPTITHLGSGYLRIRSSGPVLLKDTGGSVGIGLGNDILPSEVLHLGPSTNGTTLQIGSYTAFGDQYATGATIIGDNVKPADAPTVGMVFMDNQAQLQGGRAIEMAAQKGIVFHSTDSGAAAGAPFSSEVMRITNAGKFGIGTAAPVTRLQVNEGTGQFGQGGSLGFASTSGAFATVRGSLVFNPGGEEQGDLVFSTRPVGPAGQTLTERMRIGSDGSVTVGAIPTVPVARFSVSAASDHQLTLLNPDHADRQLYMGVASYGQARITVGGNSAFPHLVLQDFGPGNVGIGIAAGPSEKLHVNGNICATGTIGGCSDLRFKKNIEPVAGALAELAQLKPIRFDWRHEKFPDRAFKCDRQVGFVAQELLGTAPEVVSLGADGYYSVDYGRLTPVLTAAIQELHAKVCADAERITAQQAQLVELAQRLAERDQRIDDQSARVAALEALVARLADERARD